MAKPIRSEVQIDRPSQDVFDFLVDFENELKWNASITECTLLSGKAGTVGAQYRRKMKAMGQEMAMNVELTNIEPGERFVFHAAGGAATVEGTYEVHEVDNGSHVVVMLDAGMMTSFMRPIIKPQLELSLSELKKLLEAS
jgi:carbon monoxide dehydrogenase subunit G